MMQMMGMHKMGQNTDVTPQMGGFMNPTTWNSVVAKHKPSRRKLGNMGSMRQNGAHAHMGNMGSMRQNQAHAHMGKGMVHSNMGNMGSMRQNGAHAHMGKMKGHGLIAQGLRRVGNCNGLVGHALGRCRAGVRGGCIGLKGVALKNCKAHRRRQIKRALGGEWSLVKKGNGQCECTQTPRGQIVLGRYHSAKECENHRSHDC